MTLNIIYLFKFYNDLTKIYQKYIINDNCNQIIRKYDNVFDNIGNNLWKFGLDSSITEQNYEHVKSTSQHILSVIHDFIYLIDEYIPKLYSEYNDNINSFVDEIKDIYKKQLVKVSDKANNIDYYIISIKNLVLLVILICIFITLIIF